MKIEILGTGCAKCRKQFVAAEEAVRQSGIEAEVVKVEQLDEIMERGVMMTPSLVLNGKVVSSGKVVAAKVIASMLATAVAQSEANA